MRLEVDLGKIDPGSVVEVVLSHFLQDELPDRRWEALGPEDFDEDQPGGGGGGGGGRGCGDC